MIIIYNDYFKCSLKQKFVYFYLFSLKLFIINYNINNKIFEIKF